VVSRRAFLLTGAGAVLAASGAALVEARMVPGRGPLHKRLGLTGEDGVVPDVPPGEVVSGSFESAFRRTTVGWSVIRPAGRPVSSPLPVAVLLHGRGGDHTFGVEALGIDRYLAAAVRAGAPPIALAAVDGGPDNYWHRRSNGDDPQRMLLDEFVPLLKKLGLRTDRLGALGWSMGGYGALLLAADSGPRVVRAAVASSPALWRDWEDVAAGAFDGEEDFRTNSLFGRDLQGIAMRVDCGRDDPFAAAAEALRKEQPEAPAGGLQPGLHDAGYWRRLLPEQLTFLAEAL
jgi:enterochelin esterase-like enzyme